MLVETYGLTNIGKRRELNEDSYGIFGFVGDKAAEGFAVLADGMGGHNAGEIASAKAVELISSELGESFSECDPEKLTVDMANAIDYANAKIYEMSLSNSEQAGMGTTTVIIAVKEGSVQIANIGDSRAYFISGDKIERITVDHSVVEQLIISGTITREEAKNHPDKNIITRALGTESYIDADFFRYEPKIGDVLLACSDGLTEMVGEEQIRDIIKNSESLEKAANGLIETANENGGVDNITVVLIKFTDEEQEGNE